MMRIFVHEQITAHGIGRDPDSPEHSLFVEGGAMLRAICEDFAAIAGVEVLSGPPGEFAKLAAVADWSFIIAPETDGVLLKLAEEVLRVNGRLLGPGLEAIALTSDKFALFQHWRSSGIPTPETVLCPELPGSWPCVVKRRDGAGSEGTRLVETVADYRELVGRGRVFESRGRPACRRADLEDSTTPYENWIAQPLCAGQPASIAFLVGPRAILGLPATYQCISNDGQFRFGGGLVPIAPNLAVRAERLGRAALAGVKGLRGYIGVDLILGTSTDGRDDLVLEINPRLTTSYVGLRAYVDGNLAAQLLAMNLAGRRREPPNSGEPETIRQLTPPARRVAFSATGGIRIDHSSEFWLDPSDFLTNRTFFL